MLGYAVCLSCTHPARNLPSVASGLQSPDATLIKDKQSQIGTTAAQPSSHWEAVTAFVLHMWPAII